MGIDYSYQVYVHQRDAGRFLTGVAALCNPDTDEWTTVTVPGGTSVRMPGTYGLTPGRTVDLADAVAAPSTKTFDLAPCFPADEPLRHHNATTPYGIARTWPDGTTRVQVALTYLYVWDGSDILPGHWLFDFTPATSAQSRLFLSSPSIRRTFTALAASVAAPLCLLDVEELYRIVLTAQGRELSTEVAGPWVLWDVRAPKADAHRELLARLDGQPAAAPRWIVGPGHDAYTTFADDLARHSAAPPPRP